MNEDDSARTPGPGPDDREEPGAPATRGPAPAPGSAASGDREVVNPFLSHLQSLRELQITLSQEGRAESILSDGTTGTVEIVGADCAVALVEPSNGLSPLRFGWIEGRHMAQHELGMALRRLEEPIRKVRSGQVSRLVLGADAEAEPRDSPQAGAGPARRARQARYEATLVLGIDASMGSRGALVLLRHDPVPFSREQILLADILATLMAIQIERALRASDARRASERLQEQCQTATRHLHETTLELQAINAVAAAATPSLDLDRQIEIALRKTLEVTRFRAGAVFLVEQGGGEPALHFARGVGDPDYLDRAAARALGKGEGVAGRVWESGQPRVFSDLSTSEPLPEPSDELVALRRAGYRALVCVPLRARGHILGTMELLSTDARPELESRPSLAQAIADQIAIVIQNGRLLSDVMRHSLGLEAQLEARTHELARRERVLEGVQAAIETSGGIGDPREMAETALRRALELLEFPAGTVHLVDAGTRALHLRAQRGLPQSALEELGTRVSRTMIGRTLESGEPTFHSDDAADLLGADGLRLRAAVPLRAVSGVHGVLAIAGRGERALPGPEARTLAVLGEALGLMVENARAFQRTPPAGPPKKDLPPRLVQAQKMESIGTLAAGIAHEFNNILGAILGYASHIRGLTTSDNPIHRQAITIEQQSRRAAELTQHLLAFARGGQYTLEPVDMNEAIADTVSLLGKSIDPRIVIETRLDPDLPLIEADAGQMQQVLVNVAVNAAEAMSEGGRITFETRVAHLDQASGRSRPDLATGDYVAIVVGDTGCGMSPEVEDRVFEPFFTTKTEGKGTGLGLSVVYGIVRNHRGNLTITSTPGLGTTVRIYLPVLDRARRAERAAPPAPSAPRPGVPAPVSGRRPAVPSPFERVRVLEVDRRRPRHGAPDVPPPAPEPQGSPVPQGPPAGSALPARPPAPSAGAPSSQVAPRSDPPAATLVPAVPAGVPGPPTTAAAAQAPSTGRAGGKPRILVIDDEAAIRAMARDILETGGYEVVTAVDGVDALEVYRQEWGRIDLVLLDMVMPRMGGLETFRRLYGMDRVVRVLLCSGFADNEQTQKAIKEGALGLLQKPFAVTDLLSRIGRILTRR